MIHVLSKILGRKRSGSNENGSSTPSTRVKEGQSIWQKATSLRQSLRYSSRSKVGQKPVLEFSNLSPADKSATLEGKPLQREWGSQRNLSRRSLAEPSKRSLHSRSLCMEWDTSVTRQTRSPRKLTKDSGYETSAQGDPDYANSLSDWLSEEKALDQTGLVKPRVILPDKKELKDIRPPVKNGGERLEWNARHRPLSFSHQEVPSECQLAKNTRQLRHSYSQREVSRRQASVESLASNSAAAWASTPHLPPGRPQRTASATHLQEAEDPASNNMVTRRFKKGSVYDALASTSGLDFSPVVQLKTYNSRRDDSSPSGQAPKPSEKHREKATKGPHDNSLKEDEVPVFSDKPKTNPPQAFSSSPSLQEHKRNSPTEGNNEANKCLAAHEKYPSWPVVDAESTNVSYRSHSWTGQTDYPKEKIAYTRPKKAQQYKISTNQLQPVLERAPDYNSSNKSSPESSCPPERKRSSDSYRPAQYPTYSPSTEQKQFDFEAFYSPCIPPCYEEKDYRIHSPPERDGSSPPSKTPSEAASSDFNGFISRYEDIIAHQAQYSVPLSGKERGMENSKMGLASPDTPFLDRLRLENAWQMPPPPAPMYPAAGAAIQPAQLQPPPQGNDFELSSENGTWMGSMESSSHGGGSRGIPKWQGSYSDLSTLSTQLSNRSSLFDSGHSTMPESGRLSPQSSCDSTAPSLLLEGPTRAQVIARHGCHREIVAHSARVQQPERHGSESILYYATGSTSRPSSSETKSPSKPLEGATGGSGHMTAEEALFRSHASLTLSPTIPKPRDLPDRDKSSKCPTRQDSRKSSTSFSSDDSYSRPPRGSFGEDTSGSSSDVSNITCISNYKGIAKSKSLEKNTMANNANPKNLDKFPKYKPEPNKSKSIDETSRKFIFPEPDKRQRVSDPELKAIQKQAVLSFYQRMSLAESIKSEPPKQLLHSPGADTEPPPPYEAHSSVRLKMPPKLSLPPKTQIPKQRLPRSPNQSSPKAEIPPKTSDMGLLNHHSKSVPNLVMLKCQGLDSQASHPMFQQPFVGPQVGEPYRPVIHGKKPSRDEVTLDHLPNVHEKKRESIGKAAPSSESKDPPEDNGSGMHYLKPHKSPRKVQLKEVHHANEPASVKVMTPDGITLATGERAHKRRPAPPPPPKQPPRRPPPPPPPPTPPPQHTVLMLEERPDLNVDVSSPMSSPQENHEGPASPELPLPPPPSAEGNEIMMPCDDPLPPPPDPVDVQPRMLDSAALIYPKNSYMSYRSEKKLGRHGFDGKYRRSFHASASSTDLTMFDSNFHEEKSTSSPNSWEQIHNIRQHNPTVIFHSDCIQPSSQLQRSSSQDSIPYETSCNESENISNVPLPNSESNQSTNSIISQCSETPEEHSVPYEQPSQERVAFDVQNSSHSHQNSFTTKGILLKSKCAEDVVINCESTDVHSLDNETYSGSLSNGVNDSAVDLNQNSVKSNNKSEKNNPKILNGTDIINRINSATQTSDTPRLRRKHSKTKEELECEELSKDFIHYYGDVALKNLLVPAPNHKTMCDYIEGLLNLESEKNGHSLHKVSGTLNDQRDAEAWTCSEKVNALTDSKPNNCAELNENQVVDNEMELKSKKEELIISIGKKVESLKVEQTNIKAEILENELLGQDIANRLQELAKPIELEKYSLHVEETEKIVNLLLSLSGRLAKAENGLKNMPKDCSTEEKRSLEAKRDKLRLQHEDACRLKESIDRRNINVSTFLQKYLTDNEYAQYDRFIKMKTKLIVDIREIDEKINLGEEQLAALSVVAHLWKSANS